MDIMKRFDVVEVVQGKMAGTSATIVNVFKKNEFWEGRKRRGQVYLSYSDSNGLEHTFTTWAKWIDVVETY
jgi:hypothetical protein